MLIVSKVLEKLSCYSDRITASVIMSLLLLLLVPAAGRADEYIIGDGDLLKITVYDNADLTTEARVGGDGKITFPLVGDVAVRGLSILEAQKKITLLLQDGFIRNPQVSVFVSEYKSKKVTALGEFATPGLIELSGKATLMEVISNAGGLTPNAGDMLVIKRRVEKAGSDKNEYVTLTVDLDKLLSKGDVSANMMVLDGDSIYVPLASFVYVTGEVKNPGAYKITKGLTVLRAVTLAGGFTQKAWKGRTTAIRKTDKGEKTIDVKMEELVMPDDVIMVPESFF